MSRLPSTDELSRLAAETAQLAKRVRAAHEHLRRASDDATRRAGYRLDDVAGHLDHSADEITDTIKDLTRVANRGSCAAEWGLCPEHGNTLASSGGRTWCQHRGCRRRWDYDRGSLPCTESAAWRVRDPAGGETLLCTGHANDARKRLIGARVTPIVPVPGRNR